MELFHIKWPRNQFGYQSTSDLAEQFPFALTLKPHIPKADPSREDVVTPRVCFATTIEGAIGSLGLYGIKRPHIAIYKPIEPIEVIRPVIPGSKFYVHDAEKWGEVWSLRPVRVELYRIIHSTDDLP